MSEIAMCITYSSSLFISFFLVSSNCLTGTAQELEVPKFISLKPIEVIQMNGFPLEQPTKGVFKISPEWLGTFSSTYGPGQSAGDADMNKRLRLSNAFYFGDQLFLTQLAGDSVVGLSLAYVKKLPTDEQIERIKTPADIHRVFGLKPISSDFVLSNGWIEVTGDEERSKVWSFVSGNIDGRLESVAVSFSFKEQLIGSTKITAQRIERATLRPATDSQEERTIYPTGEDILARKRIAFRKRLEPFPPMLQEWILSDHRKKTDCFRTKPNSHLFEQMIKHSKTDESVFSLMPNLQMIFDDSVLELASWSFVKKREAIIGLADALELATDSESFEIGVVECLKAMGGGEIHLTDLSNRTKEISIVVTIGDSGYRRSGTVFYSKNLAKQAASTLKEMAIDIEKK